MCIVSRIPELLSPDLVLDGDECVVAIMAKHIMKGQAFSPFFYGQAYGFSLIECLFIIPFYFIFGITTLAVKLGMLTLWATGVLFLYQAFLHINKSHKWLPLLFILIFIWSPAWAAWSMKARGGYLTAFTLASIVLCLLFREKKSYAVTVFAGILVVLIYQSKSIWIPGLVPFIIFFLMKNKKHLLAFITPVLLLSIAAWFYKQSMLEFGVYEVDYSLANLWPRICRIPAFLYCSLHGNYYLSAVLKPNVFCAVQALGFAVLTFALPLIAVYNIITRKKETLLFNLSACSIALTLLLTIFTESIKGRFLLPITGYVLFSFLLWLNTVTISKKILYSTASNYIAMGIVSLITFYNFSFLPVREKPLKTAISYLENKGIHYAYCTDNMFTWQVIFYSNEQVICHERRLPGRFPKYAWQVDSAYYGGAKAAYIAQPGFPSEINFPRSEMVGDCYIATDPPKEMISKEFPRQNTRPDYYYCKY